MFRYVHHGGGEGGGFDLLSQLDGSSLLMWVAKELCFCSEASVLKVILLPILGLTFVISDESFAQEYSVWFLPIYTDVYKHCIISI